MAKQRVVHTFSTLKTPDIVQSFLQLSVIFQSLTFLETIYGWVNDLFCDLLAGPHSRFWNMGIYLRWNLALNALGVLSKDEKIASLFDLCPTARSQDTDAGLKAVWDQNPSALLLSSLLKNKVEQSDFHSQFFGWNTKKAPTLQESGCKVCELLTTPADAWLYLGGSFHRHISSGYVFRDKAVSSTVHQRWHHQREASSWSHHDWQYRTLSCPSPLHTSTGRLSWVLINTIGFTRW